jgi:hypothetical protein
MRKQKHALAEPGSWRCLPAVFGMDVVKLGAQLVWACPDAVGSKKPELDG